MKLNDRRGFTAQNQKMLIAAVLVIALLVVGYLLYSPRDTTDTTDTTDIHFDDIVGDDIDLTDIENF